MIEDEILAVLKAVDAGQIQPEVIDDDSVYARFRCGDWLFVVFNDAGGWDYLELATAPDGRTWEYPSPWPENKHPLIDFQPENPDYWPLKGDDNSVAKAMEPLRPPRR